MNNNLTIRFAPTAKQFTAWSHLNDSKTAEIGYGGGASGGKTWLLTVWIGLTAIAFPDTGWLIGRRELKNLKRTTLATFFKMAAEYNISHLFNLDSQNSVIKCVNGSDIFLYDLAHIPSDPLFLRLGGLELTGAAVDESNEISVKAIDILKTRIGRRNNEKYKIYPKLLETFNPDKGHVYHRYYKPYKDNKMPEYRIFIPALPKDNPYTSKDYILQLKRSDKATKERLLYGNFEYDDSPYKLFEYDKIIDMFTNFPAIEEEVVEKEVIEKEFMEKYITVDAARLGKDTAVIFVWQGLTVKEIKVIDKCRNDELAAEVLKLAEKHQVPRSNIIVDEVGVGGGIVDSLRCKGFVAGAAAIQPPASRNDQLKRVQYANLKTQCFCELAKLVNSGKIAITADLTSEVKTRLIEELDVIEQVDVDKDGKIKITSKDIIKEKLGRSPDLADAMSFRLFFEVKRKGKFRLITF